MQSLANWGSVDENKCLCAQRSTIDVISITSYDKYLTNIPTATEEDTVKVKDGKITVTQNTEVAIYTITGKLVTKGNAGEYTLPTGNYIVKFGNKAIKVSINKLR